MLWGAQWLRQCVQFPQKVAQLLLLLLGMGGAVRECWLCWRRVGSSGVAGAWWCCLMYRGHDLSVQI